MKFSSAVPYRSHTLKADSDTVGSLGLPHVELRLEIGTKQIHGMPN